nr:RidA family protein [uncultured Cupriavidus sp.]
MNPPPLAAYSPARRAGGHVHLAGMSPRTHDGCTGVTTGADGERVYDIGVQTACVLDKIDRALQDEGLDLAHCVTMTCYLVDMQDYAAFNAAYDAICKPRFASAGQPLPARTCVAVAALPHPDMRVEITATAWQDTPQGPRHTGGQA